MQHLEFGRLERATDAQGFGPAGFAGAHGTLLGHTCGRLPWQRWIVEDDRRTYATDAQRSEEGSVGLLPEFYLDVLRGNHPVLVKDRSEIAVMLREDQGFRFQICEQPLKLL